MQLAELLLEREVVFTEDVERIFGKRTKSATEEALAAEEVAQAEQTVASEDNDAPSYTITQE